MERENKYIVVKIKDAQKHLSVSEANRLELLALTVDEGRKRDGKHPMECVAVECDWPEYEHVWDMIEARVDGASLIPTHSGWWWYVDPDCNVRCARVDRRDNELVATIPDLPEGSILRIPVDALEGEWHGEAKFPVVK